MQVNPNQPQLIFFNEWIFSQQLNIKFFESSTHLAVGEVNRFTVWDLSTQSDSPVTEINNDAHPNKASVLVCDLPIVFSMDKIRS